MTRNVGRTDTLVRLGIALAALAGAYVAGLGSVAGFLLLVVAAIAAVTAGIRFCPVYRVLGVTTCATR